MEAAELMKITSHELLEMDVVDKVISEAELSSKELIKKCQKRTTRRASHAFTKTSRRVVGSALSTV